MPLVKLFISILHEVTVISGIVSVFRLSQGRCGKADNTFTLIMISQKPNLIVEDKPFCFPLSHENILTCTLHM